MRMAALLAALLALSPAAAQAQPEGSFTRQQIRAMTPEQISRRLFGDLGQIMFMLPDQTSDAAFAVGRSLDSLFFMARPRRTERIGICATDTVVVGFERVPGARPEQNDPPMRPLRLQSSTSYYIQDAALALEARAPAPAEQEPMQAACAAVDPRTVRPVYATAGGEETVASAFKLLSAVVAGARAGNPAYMVDCRGRGAVVLPQENCLPHLVRISPENVSNVYYPEACRDRPSDRSVQCWTIIVRDGSISRGLNVEADRAAQIPLKVVAYYQEPGE